MPSIQCLWYLDTFIPGQQQNLPRTCGQPVILTTTDDGSLTEKGCFCSAAALFGVSSALCPTRLYDPALPIIQEAYTHRNDLRLVRPQNKQATQHSSALWKRCRL